MIELEADFAERAIISYRDSLGARPKAVLLLEISDGRIIGMQDYRRLAKARRVATMISPQS